MKLSIVYNISKHSDTLLNSLKSLANIKGGNFEIIFILNLKNNDLIKDIINKIDFKKIKTSFVFLNQNLGHSYAYNTGQKLSIGEYIYFAGGKNIFKEDFMEELEALTKNEVFDVIVLVDGGAIKFTKESFIKNKNTDLMNIKRKIINKHFIEENKLSFTNYKYFNLLYLFTLNEKAKKIGYIEKKVCDFMPTKKVNYNLYDILTSSEILFKKVSESSFNNDKKDYYYMVITINILYDFIYKIFKNYDDKHVIQNAISNAYMLIEKIYPQFRENQYFIKNVSRKLPNYILNFKPTIKYCKKVLEVY
ncbi:MAG: glycosyltransferase [Mycoplasmoidaceae bacterium]